MTAQEIALGTSDSTPTSPVDDRTYNVLQALTSTLEAIAAYESYVMDDEDELFERLIEDEQEHARLLLDELRTRLASG